MSWLLLLLVCPLMMLLMMKGMHGANKNTENIDEIKDEIEVLKNQNNYLRSELENKNNTDK